MQQFNNVLSKLTAGFVAVLIGFTSSVALIYQLVINLGGTSELVASWLLILGLTIGLTSIFLSLYYKIPVMVAWSTPGAALLITSTQGYSLEQATGAFIISALMIFICGLSGIFAKLMHKIPQQLANAMLAGVLVNFGIEVFNLIEQEALIILSMLLAYLLSKKYLPKFTMLLVLGTCLLLAWQQEIENLNQISWQISQFHFTQPQFDFSAMISIALPLFVVTMASQNMPGIAVLKAHDYSAPVSTSLTVTGLANMLAAPFGGFAFNLAAITAAICMSKDVDPNKHQRYWASVAAGGFYILMGVFAASLIGIVETLPQSIILALAGIALFSTIASSLKQALEKPALNEASIITFLVTASDLAIWNIGSALWGILAGAMTLLILNYSTKTKLKEGESIPIKSH